MQRRRGGSARWGGSGNLRTTLESRLADTRVPANAHINLVKSRPRYTRGFHAGAGMFCD